VAVDPAGNVYFCGATYSADFPVTPEVFQANYRGNGDAYAIKLSADCRKLLYATYLGGSAADASRTVAIDSKGNFFVAGNTQSKDWPIFRALQQVHSGHADGVVGKFFLK